LPSSPLQGEKNLPLLPGLLARTLPDVVQRNAQYYTYRGVFLPLPMHSNTFCTMVYQPTRWYIYLGMLFHIIWNLVPS